MKYSSLQFGDNIFETIPKYSHPEHAEENIDLVHMHCIGRSSFQVQSVNRYQFGHVVVLCTISWLGVGVGVGVVVVAEWGWVIQTALTSFWWVVGWQAT